jgi:DNA-binding transcriptional regulator YhcF (GntR family)
MINQEKWVPNSRLPSIKSIANKLKVSYSTVRNAFTRFQLDGTIDNYGYLGFYLKSNKNVKSKSSSLFSDFKLYVSAADLFEHDAKKISNWAVKYNDKTDKIFGLNLITGIRINSTLRFIDQILKKPVTIEEVADSIGSLDHVEIKDMYDKQIEVLPLARLVMKHRREIIQ